MSPANLEPLVALASASPCRRRDWFTLPLSSTRSKRCLGQRDYFRKQRGRPMRRNWSVRAVLLSAFALGVTAGPIRAGEPQPLPLPAPAPAMSYAPVAGDPVYLPPDAVLPEWRVATLNAQPASLRERVGNCFKKVLIADAPWFCYADHN